MEARTGDPRVYFLSAFFFSCIVSGGVFLGLYLFLPLYQTKAWYPIAGLFLVAIPWIFWFLTYIYRCIKPQHNSSQSSKTFPRSTPGDVEASANEPPNPSSHLNSKKHDDIEQSANDQHSSTNDGRRHVHFGGVNVIREYDNGDDNQDNNSSSDERDECEGSDVEHGGTSQEREKTVDSRESETPLTR